MEDELKNAKKEQAVTQREAYRKERSITKREKALNELVSPSPLFSAWFVTRS